MEQFRMCELEFKGETLTKDWARIDLTAEFSCGDKTQKVTGFYAGDGVYKVRFLPEESGTWSYRVTGCVTAEGMVRVEPAKEGSRGLVRAEECHFRSQNGQLFYPFGTTVYALMHQDDELVKTTFESLREAPFNKVRFCVFPKSYDYNHNEPPVFAFEKKEDGSWDVNRPCIAFWDRLDAVFKGLEAMDIQGDLILFHSYDRWGFAKMSQEENLIYLDYLLRRVSAWPNLWWSLANEYDLMMRDISLADWEEIECFVADHDPYHHLLSNHNCFAVWDYSRPNVTHVSIQTKMLTRISEWRKKYKKPVIVDECCYEGTVQRFWGSISGREMTNRFWRVVTTGGYCTHGETFMDWENEVLWWARGGKLKGESPKRIAFLKDIVESLPGSIEPVDPMLAGILNMTPEEREETKKHAPEKFKGFLDAIGRLGDELPMFASVEFEYRGRCGEDAYLTFYDLRTCEFDELELPEDKTYRIELIDTWEMTRETLIEKASGKTEIRLPAKEGMAVLATRIDQERS